MCQKKIILFFPSIEKGGAEKNLFIVANYLCNKFKKLKVISCSKDAKKNFNKKIEFLCPDYEIWDNLGRGIKTFISIIFLIKQILQDRKIVVLSFQANVYAVIVCKIFSIKIITRSNSFPGDWSNSSLKNFVFKIILPLANTSIVNSIETKKKFKSNYKINAKCIYNPLNSRDILKLSNKKIKSIYLNKNSLKIIHVGRFSEEKDHNTFLNALRFINSKINFEAIIMGRGKLKNKILKIIDKNKLKKKVRIIDYKKNPYPYIKQADFLILTSLHEGLPNILLEAIILKKFVISSNCPTGPREILDDGKGGGLFKVGISKELAKKIILYSKKKKLRKEKIRYAFSRIGRFDYEFNLELYSNLIKKYY